MKFDDKAERAIIGAALLADSQTLDQMFGEIKTEDFYRESHRGIWRGMVRTWKSARSVDLVLLTRDIHDAGDLELIGGASAIAPFAVDVPRVQSWRLYHGSMQEARRSRDAAAIGLQLQAAAEGGDVFALAETAIAGLLRISGEAPAQSLPTFRSVGSRFVDWMQAGEKEYNRIGRSPQMSFGWKEIDKTLPVFPGKSMLLAGGSGSGKSGLALQGLITTAIERGEGGLFISLEMSAELAFMRAISRRIDISESKIMEGSVSGSDISKIEKLVQETSGLPLIIDDQCPSDVVSIDRRIRAAAKEGIKWVVVDYLQLMHYPGRKFDRLSLELGAITYQLHRTAQRFGIGLILLAQIKKTGEFTTSKTKDDIKDGGDSVQAVDVVSVIWRPHDIPEEERERRSKDSPIRDDVMRIETSKHRYGQPCGDRFAWSRGRVSPLGQTWDRLPNGDASRWVRELDDRNVYKGES